MVGAGTARADDPDLRVRDLGATRQPVRIVVDTALSLDPASRLGRAARDAPVWLCHGPQVSDAARQAWAATGARLLICPLEDGRVAIDPALRLLAQKGLTRILCEGGGQLAASLLRAHLVSEIVTFVAGAALGADATPSVGPLGVGRLAEARRFVLQQVQAVGGDVMARWIAP